MSLLAKQFSHRATLVSTGVNARPVAARRPNRRLTARPCCELTATETKPAVLTVASDVRDTAKVSDDPVPSSRTLKQGLIAVSPTTASMDGADSDIVELNPDTFNEFVMEVPAGTLVVVDFYTDWCGPCKIMSKELEKLSTIFKTVKFAKFNCGKWEGGFLTQQRVRSLPTFRFYTNGKVVDEVKGAKVVELRQLLLIHSNRSASMLRRTISMSQREASIKRPSVNNSL